NEWTRNDPVVRLAGWLEKRIPGFGQAGRTGFRGHPALIHNVGHPTKVCNYCGGSPAVLIHNIDCSGLGHSGAFLGPAHAARFWLPYLWGLDPADYGLLLDFCESAADQQELGNIEHLIVVEDELLDHDWRWAGRTLKAYITDLAKEDRRRGKRSADELVGRIVRLFWQTIERARAARETGDPNEARWLTYLYPWQAVTHALERVLASP
ncbi:MAG: hypothetical protein ACRD1B_12050, partial [Thermoanaerobaculia bacterium]